MSPADPPRPRVRVVLADDHALFRQGLRALLSRDPRIAVVGEAANGDDAVAVVLDERPDIVILDIEMPGLSTPVAISRIRTAAPATRCLVLTMHDDPGIARHVRDSGAEAYLSKTIDTRELVTLLTRPAVSLSSPRGMTTEIGPLSNREREVLRLIAQGRSNQDIADVLFIAVGTVKRHVSQIFAKLGVHSRTQALKAARLLGVLGD